MQTVNDLKNQAVTDTPLLVFDCVFRDGRAEHWCTHAIAIGSTKYDARVLQHSAFDLQTASDQGVDGSPRIVVLLANSDSYFSEIEQSLGFKGARLTVGFVFYDLRNDLPLTDTTIIFQGICNPPDQVKEATFRLTAGNRMNLQRLFLPTIRIQRRCPWEFPATQAQRMEALDGGAAGKYSRFYRCGYSPDISGGRGNLHGGDPFTSCGYTRSDCQARGMWNRFGGIEFVPPAITVRPYGKDWQTSAVAVNQARYNDFVPMVYGTAWYNPPVVFARNDGNLTRMEVLLGIGEMQGVLKVLVNDVEIPAGVAGQNMTGTGWFNIPTLGTRDGGFDLNFTDASGNPAGDPYGSMAYLAVIVPTRLSSGDSIPTVKVLAQGLKVPVYTIDGSYLGEQFSSNPAWILLDILLRCGWSASEIDVTTFAATAAYCDEQIEAVDLNGNAINLSRFQCNLVLQNRRSVGDVVRGIRNTARLYLTYGPGGMLQLQVENTLALGQPSKPSCSNSSEPLNGGWPSYEFGDGSSGLSGILRRPNGEPSLTLWSRSIADTPNSFTVEFQDALNSYQQDSYALVDPEDVALAGQEVSSKLMALGIPNYDQAARILKYNLDKSVHGNTYVQFDTSVKALGIRPGDIITLTYLKEGFNRQPFRVLKISPATNYRTATIVAQIHDDAWYADSNGQTNSSPGNSYNGSAGIGVPKPLLGSILDENGDIQFGIVESSSMNSDGSAQTNVSVSFTPPATVVSTGPGRPLINLVTNVGNDGTIKGGQTLYYAVSGEDSSGNESMLSFIVPAVITNDDSSVRLTGLSFAPGTSKFHVYRGTTPAKMLRIASDETLATEFTDTGLNDQLVVPPDPNFDHANFYWRMEQQPEIGVTIHSPTTVGNATLQMPANEYKGMTVRITRGKGEGQERAIAGNDATVLTVLTPWDLEPDTSSFFVVADAAWRFGAQTKSSPVEFSVPNFSGEVVQVTGRAANVNDVESEPLLATVTRWTIGGSGTADSDIPPTPSFGLAVPREGVLELSGLSFSTLNNTAHISSATLTIHYSNELQQDSPPRLVSEIAPGEQLLSLESAGTASIGSILQVDAELMQVVSVQANGMGYQVTRGIHGSEAVAHVAGARVYELVSKTIIAPFSPGFFGSPYSAGWTYALPLTSVRVASAELFVTNNKGQSPTSVICLTRSRDNGLRTLSGGQINLTVDGVVAIQSNAVPAATLPQACSVRDIFATIDEAPVGSPLTCVVKVNGTAIATLTIPEGELVSNTVDMTTSPSVEGILIPAGQPVTLDILTVGTTYPGKRLAAIVRF